MVKSAWRSYAEVHLLLLQSDLRSEDCQWANTATHGLLSGVMYERGVAVLQTLAFQLCLWNIPFHWETRSLDALMDFPIARPGFRFIHAVSVLHIINRLPLLYTCSRYKSIHVE